MMFYISYFAQFRNMTPKQICFSTALWDPKWFHDFREQSYKFVKDGKTYGLRATCFNPMNHECSGMPCPHLPHSCNFLQAYEKQLDALKFNDVIAALRKSANEIAKQLHIVDPEVVLLVHEAPDNPCSERHVIKKWFAKHGMILKEWMKPE